MQGSPDLRAGFIPLSTSKSEQDLQRPTLSRSPNNEHVVDIPLTPMRTNASTGARKEGHSARSELLSSSSPSAEIDTMGQWHSGRRRLARKGIGNGEEGSLNSLGRFYEKLINFSIVTRYILYIIPVSLLLAIPTLIGGFGPGKNATVGGVRMVWFMLWIQIIWVSLWVSKLFAKALPTIFKVLAGVVSSGVRKYSTVIRALELPLSLVGWALTSLTTFTPIMTRNPEKMRTNDTGVKPWQARMNSILAACLVSALIYLGQRVFIQLVSVNYHRKQFESRIKANKRNVKLLSQLYEVSRSLFPDYTEFAEEDYIIHQGFAGSILTPALAQKKNGTATPMRQLIGNLNVVGNKVTSAFGNIAQEVTGNKNVFNPNSGYSIVLDALQRKDSSEALTKRIWMSFVVEGNEALTMADLLEVMGSDHEEVAYECFAMLDKDDNGDVSLEEMINGVLFMQMERRDVAKSIQDVDNAIGVLDNVLGTVVSIVVIFVFVAFNLSNFNTMLAAAGTVLLSLSFVFAITAQEVLGSCIFLFVKHPYDVGDRVDIDDKQFYVEHISLLYTVFRRCDNKKTSQVPNNILNTKWIENISRSKDMQEIIKVSVNYGTTLEDIQALREEMLKFIKENNRDYRPEFEIEVLGVNDLDKLDLKIEIKHKSNWANEQLTLQRRNKFLCALVLAMKKVPIYGPDRGDPAVGEEAKPMYTVTISDDHAQKNMEKAEKAKLAKRWDAPAETPSGESADEARELRKPMGDTQSPAPLNVSVQPAMGFTSYDGYGQQPQSDEPRMRKQESVRSSRTYDSRLGDITEVRTMLTREATRGRRKPIGRSGTVISHTSTRHAPLSPTSPYSPPTLSQYPPIQGQEHYPPQRLTQSYPTQYQPQPQPQQQPQQHPPQQPQQGPPPPRF